ncbi:DUF1266 domain-containing protein [Myroides fluvii]|uniref:DUF1266 domain-containing protein n=1 Tax=Myroides fluvii TaxID=2572594 RepID=UPI00131D16E5|nr:DUF1266 domain-containing protein [Myroides fluvii]
MSFFSKILNAFKSIRLNPKNGVTGQRLDHLLLSSMYAEQQSAYLNSYETGLSTATIKTLLEDYWQLFDKADALEILSDLQNRNQDKYIDIVYRAFEDKENYVAILKSNLPAEEEVFNYYLAIYKDLNNLVPELIEEGVVQNFAILRQIKDAGWNYGRGAFLARCCFDMGYLTEEEIKDYLEQSYIGIKTYCSSWKEYTVSYIFGRALWSGANNNGMIQIAQDLLENETSPLKNKTFF